MVKKVANQKEANHRLRQGQAPASLVSQTALPVSREKAQHDALALLAVFTSTAFYSKRNVALNAHFWTSSVFW